MIKKISISLVIGLLITIWIVQDDPWIKKIVGDIFIDKFESALECTLHGSVKKIDFFGRVLS